MSTYVPPSSRLVQTAAGDSGKRNNTNIQTTGNQVYGTGETAKADAYIQTEVTCFDQSVPQFPKPMLKERTPINTVKRKAYCDGVRVEVVDTSGTSVVGNHTNKYQQPMPTLCLHPGIYRWDVSRRFAKAKGLVQVSHAHHRSLIFLQLHNNFRCYCTHILIYIDLQLKLHKLVANYFIHLNPFYKIAVVNDISDTLFNVFPYGASINNIELSWHYRSTNIRVTQLGK